MFARQKHIEYIVNLDNKEKDTFEFYVTEHLRMSGIYWAITALDILKKVDQMDTQKIVGFVLKCQHQNGTKLFNFYIQRWLWRKH